MPDQNLVDNIRRENYHLQIYQAYHNNAHVIPMTTKLIKTVQEIYRYIEPSHFGGNLVCFCSIEDAEIIDNQNAYKLIDKNILVNNSSDTLVIQVFLDNRIPLLWQNISIDGLVKSSNVVVYSYKDKNECFYANDQLINIINYFDCASIYALQYHYLNEAFLKYKEEKIKYSSCPIFNDSWFDKKRIFFKGGGKDIPERFMQESLEEFLKSSLRGVDVVREYNLNASKPVDVRVYWKEANRAALIEMKWLGKSKKKDGNISTEYYNGRANDGAVQMKEYLDFENQDTPTCITKGYLVVIDGRRNRTNKETTTINNQNGMYYSNMDLTFDDDKQYYNTIFNFEKPIRMFTTPICE